MLQYRDRQPAGNFGNWDLRNNAFFKPAALTSFGVACFADERRCGRGPTDEGSLEVSLCGFDGSLSYPGAVCRTWLVILPSMSNKKLTLRVTLGDW